MVARWAEMTPTEKLQIVQDLNESVAALAIAGIRDRHPGATDHEVKMRLGVLRYGDELMRRAYGWNAGIEGL
jgi:hypothetical protein